MQKEQTLLDHLRELQLRLICTVLVLVAGGVAGYLFYDQILNVLISPLGQTLYFTKPGGGFELLIKVCLLVGFLASLPVLLYQIFSFLAPLIQHSAKRFIAVLSGVSVLLLGLGVSFGYFVAMPAALRFLLEFSSESVQALITTDSYLSFILAYLAISAVIFQLPIILLFIDRIKPQKPGKLFAKQYWVILGSFIVAAIVTPTVDPLNQAIIAVPIIVLYNLAIVALLVFGKSRRQPSRQVAKEAPLRRKEIDRSLTQRANYLQKPSRPRTLVEPPQAIPVSSQRTSVSAGRIRSLDGMVAGKRSLPPRIRPESQPRMSRARPATSRGLVMDIAPPSMLVPRRNVA